MPHKPLKIVPRHRTQSADRVNSARTLFVARRAARLTQHQLAKLAQVDHSFISLIESGDRELEAVGHATVVRLARALNITADDLCPVPFTDEQAS